MTVFLINFVNEFLNLKTEPQEKRGFAKGIPMLRLVRRTASLASSGVMNQWFCV